MELAGRPSIQWECPDLIQLDNKWVLLVSVNPGGPILGSGTMYFVGDFDGMEFKADALDYPLWLDYGMDNYAGVTWSNTGERKVMIGWMNNWQYAGSVPCSPWRSAMTLPRELKLTEYNGSFSIPSMQAPLNVSGNTVTLDLFVDQSSVELISNDGAMSMTNLVFPQTIYDHCIITGADCEVQCRRLTSIWN